MPAWVRLTSEDVVGEERSAALCACEMTTRRLAIVAAFAPYSASSTDGPPTPDSPDGRAGGGSGKAMRAVDWSGSHSVRQPQLMRKVLPWLGLAAVLSASVYGMNSATAAIGSASSTAAEQSAATTFWRANNATLHDDAMSVSSHPMLVMITGIDSMTGQRMQVECATVSDRVATDALIVDLKELQEVASGICR
jgi:hypothetical protein